MSISYCFTFFKCVKLESRRNSELVYCAQPQGGWFLFATSARNTKLASSCELPYTVTPTILYHISTYRNPTHTIILPYLQRTSSRCWTLRPLQRSTRTLPTRPSWRPDCRLRSEADVYQLSTRNANFDKS